jgi:hypothetical protein
MLGSARCENHIYDIFFSVLPSCVYVHTYPVSIAVSWTHCDRGTFRCQRNYHIRFPESCLFSFFLFLLFFPVFLFCF